MTEDTFYTTEKAFSLSNGDRQVGRKYGREKRSVLKRDGGSFFFSFLPTPHPHPQPQKERGRGSGVRVGQTAFTLSTGEKKSGRKIQAGTETTPFFFFFFSVRMGQGEHFFCSKERGRQGERIGESNFSAKEESHRERKEWNRERTFSSPVNRGKRGVIAGQRERFLCPQESGGEEKRTEPREHFPDSKERRGQEIRV